MIAMGEGMTGEFDESGHSKGGAPEDNANALRHGLYSAKAHELLSRYALRASNAFRRSLEAATIDAHGGVSVTHAAYINTATEAQRVALANRELLARLEESETPPDADLRLRFDAEYVKMLERRDAKVKALTLDAAKGGSDPLAFLDGQVIHDDVGGVHEGE